MKFRKIAAAVLTLALGFCLCQPAAYAAEQKAELDGLSVSIQSTGETPLPKETLTVELKAEGNAPLPADGITTLEIMDGETAKFGSITYTKPGAYHYTVTQKAGTNSRGVYDDTVYHVVVTALWEDGRFGCQVAVHTQPDLKDTKRESILFTNRYQPITPPIDPGDPYDPVPTPPAPTTPENPAPADARPTETPTIEPETPAAPAPADTPTQVADARPTEAAKPEGPKLIQTGQLNWPVPVLTVSGLALVAVGGYLLHRGKKRDENA